jgi:hypothetical protein
MLAKPSSPEIPSTRGWPSRVKSAAVHAISLGQPSLAFPPGWVVSHRRRHGSESRQGSLETVPALSGQEAVYVSEAISG